MISCGKATLADAATSYAAFDPHEARLADLLREFAPDNRLVNAYIDYAMSDPADTDAEGRWKNMVDNTLAGVPFALSGAVYQGGKALVRAIRGVGFESALPGAPATQRGAIGAVELTAERLPVSPAYEQVERALTPETRTELIAMRADAEAYQPTYKTTLQEIARDATGDPANALVADMKGWDRIAEKVVTEEGGDASGIRDMVRGTVLVRSKAEAENVWSDLQTRFPSASTTPRTSLLDGMADNLGYRDLKMNIVGPNGRLYEVQVTTPELWAAKNGRGHKIYQEWRTLVGQLKQEQRAPTKQESTRIAALEDESRALYAAAFDEAAFANGKPLTMTGPGSNSRKDPSGNSSSDIQ